MRFPIDGITFEEFESFVESCFLSVIDEGDSIHDEGEGSKDFGAAAEALVDGPEPAIFVVIGGHEEEISALGEEDVHVGLDVVEVGCGIFSLGDGVEAVHHRPGVGGMEGFELVVREFRFGEEEEVVACFEKGGGEFIPEFGRDAGCVVAAISINSEFGDPVAHGVDLVVEEIRVVKIHLDDIGPIKSERGNEGAVFVGHVEFRIGFGEGVIPCGVVSDPIKNDAHAAGMGGVDEGAKVLRRSEFRVNALVIFDGVIAPEGSFAVYFTDGVDGHEPEGTDPEVLYAIEIGLHRGEGAFRGVLAHVDFVDDLIADPVR